MRPVPRPVAPRRCRAFSPLLQGCGRGDHRLRRDGHAVVREGQGLGGRAAGGERGPRQAGRAAPRLVPCGGADAIGATVAPPAEAGDGQHRHGAGGEQGGLGRRAESHGGGGEGLRERECEGQQAGASWRGSSLITAGSSGGLAFELQVIARDTPAARRTSRTSRRRPRRART